MLSSKSLEGMERCVESMSEGRVFLISQKDEYNFCGIHISSCPCLFVTNRHQSQQSHKVKNNKMILSNGGHSFDRCPGYTDL